MPPVHIFRLLPSSTLLATTIRQIIVTDIIILPIKNNVYF